MTKNTSLVLRETAAIVDAHTLLKLPVADMPVEDVTLAWSVLDIFEKELVGPRKEEFRQRMFALIEESGVCDNPEKSPSKYIALKELGAKITKSHKAGKVVVNSDAAIQMLEGKPAASELIIRTTLSFTPSQFEALQKSNFDLDSVLATKRVSVDTGALEAAVSANLLSLRDLKEVTSVGEPSYALLVKKPKVVQELLERSKNQIAEG